MPRRRVPASVTRALLALAAASGVAVLVVYLIAIRTAEGRRLDDRAKGTLSEQSRAFDETSDLLDTISVSSLALLGATIMAIALLRGRPRLALGAGVVVLGANLTTQAMKAQLDRPGPFGPRPASYPSGHVTVAMSLAMALILVAPPDLRVAATLLGTAYAIAVGVAVIAVDWHRPSDVVGAYLVTVAWTALVAAVLASPPGPGSSGAAADAEPGRPRRRGRGRPARGHVRRDRRRRHPLAARPGADRGRPHRLRRGRGRLRAGLCRARGRRRRPHPAGGLLPAGGAGTVGSPACASASSPAGVTAPA